MYFDQSSSSVEIARSLVTLTGASMALLNEERRAELMEIQRKCKYLELSGNSVFNQLFPEHMTFDKEEFPWN